MANIDGPGEPWLRWYYQQRLARCNVELIISETYGPKLTAQNLRIDQERNACNGRIPGSR
jgi:hypothetical protein